MTHTVKIYTTPSCKYCHAAKEYFKANNIEFTDYDVTVDIPHQQEMIQKTGMLSVPVIDIDGTIIIGFDKPKIDQLLGLGLKAAA